jgi:hypothetical protein
MHTQLIVGFGTGRCGTASLAAFLNQQPGYAVTHEAAGLSWVPAFTDTEVCIRQFSSRLGLAAGDVGFYWIHYLDLVLRQFEHAKAINIRRDLDDVIESFWSYLSIEKPREPANGWYGYPYDSDKATKDSLAYTMRRYRYMEHEVGKLYPGSIFLMGMEDLNKPDILDLLLNWIGTPHRKVTVPVRSNTREEVLTTRNDRNHGRLFNKTFRKGVKKNDSTTQVS